MAAKYSFGLGPIRLGLSKLWAYRGFVAGSVRREFQLRYRDSLLGAAWSILSPLSMVLIYTLVFSQVMRARVPGVEGTFSYSIFLMAGLLPWGIFTEILNRHIGLFQENANLIKKVNFPKICLPIIVLINSLLNFSIIFGIFLAFLIVSGDFPGLVLISFIPIFILQVLFSMGLGIILAILTVFFRDVSQALPIILQFWFWLTPIIYSIDILPKNFRDFLNVNPLLPVFTAYQQIFLMREWPNWQSLIFFAGLTIAVNVMAVNFYRRNIGDIVDEL